MFLKGPVMFSLDAKTSPYDVLQVKPGNCVVWIARLAHSLMKYVTIWFVVVLVSLGFVPAARGDSHPIPMFHVSLLKEVITRDGDAITAESPTKSKPISTKWPRY
ncbi:hypothetical protein V1519DRAFT_432193 [Lipomyces tetrasporus]